MFRFTRKLRKELSLTFLYPINIYITNISLEFRIKYEKVLFELENKVKKIYKVKILN